MTVNPAPAAGHPASSEFPDGIIGVAHLRTLLGGPGLVVLDCRHDLAQPDWGAQQYRLGHIPGAVFAHLDHDLAGTRNGRNGRHPLPPPDAFAARLRSWGVGSASRVVVYDAAQGAYAARAWWMLRWLGHRQVAVLDGGWQAWQEAGLAISDATPPAEKGDFGAAPSLQPIATAEAVLAVAQHAATPDAAGALLIDARAPDRFEGRNETVDPVAGHIPGAINRFWKQNLDEHGRFKQPSQLRAEFRALLQGRAPRQVIAQCGSGVTACHNILALHLAGLPGAALYPGSWSEWIADPSRPLAQGA
jgi:thiosulfate/3-mercaptopyruvate sulfurtransferase